MRRSDKEITDKAQIDSIIRQSKVCRLGLADEGQPYIVPLCFGYDGEALYFHCAKEGRKIEILRKNSTVCFEFDIVEGLVEADGACDWGIRYQSVIGFGKAQIIEDINDKKEAHEFLMAQYSNRSFYFSEEKLAITAVIKVEIKTMTGKQSKRF